MKLKTIFAVLTLCAALPVSAGPELTMNKTEFAAAEKLKSYRFAGYPTQNRFKGKSVSPNLKNETARVFKTRLRAVLAENKPNAAGIYSTYGFGCGSSGCMAAGAVNNHTGTPVPLGEVLMGCGGVEEHGGLRSDPKSNLVIASGCMEGRLKDSDGISRFGHHYFLLKNGKFRHIRSVRVQD